MVSKNIVEIIINAKDMASNAIDNVNKSLKNMESTGKSSTDQITNSTSRLNSALEKVRTVSDTVKNGLNSLGSAGKSALSSIGNILNEIGSRIKNVGTSFSSLTSSFSTVAESIKNQWTNMTSNLKGVWDSFSSGLGNIGQSISESLSGAGASISGLFESIRNEASSISMSFSGIGEGIRESLSSASMSASTLFASMRNEASSVSMSFSGIGEGIRESLSSASMSISTIFSSIRQEASSLGTSISGAFDGIGQKITSSLSGVSSSISSVKSGVLGMASGLSDVGDLISSKIGITGVNSFKELTVGLALSREKMTTLMRATMGSAEAADTLINKWDHMTDNSVVSLDMMIGAFNKVKMSSGQTAEKLSELANSNKQVNGSSTNLSSTLIRLGEAAILMGDDVGHAQFVMADAMDGLNGNFRTLQMNLGITKEKLLDAGWSGASDDVEGYIAALNKCLDGMGDMSSVMDTNAGAIEKLEKAFRVAGRKIGEIITPIIGNLIDMFNWLDQVLDFGATNEDGTHKSMHRLYTAVILVFGALSLLTAILPLVALGLRLYNSATEAGIISTTLLEALEVEELTLNELLSASFWQLAIAEHAAFFELLLAVAIIIAVVAAIKYFYDNNETVRHSINVLAYELNAIFGRAWEEIQKIIQPLIPTFQHLWNTLVYLVEVLTGTQTATDGAKRGFDYLEAIIYVIGNTILFVIEVIVKLVEILLAILVPCINLIVNILSELIQFIIKVAQAFSLLMQGDYVGFFNTLKDAIWNLVTHIATFIGQALLEIYHNLWSILGNIITAIIDWLKQIPGIIWNFILNIPNMIYNLAGLILYAIGFLLGLIWKYFTEWQPQLFTLIVDTIIYIGQLLITEGIPALISFAGMCYNALVEGFWKMVHAAEEIIPHLPEIIWNELVKIGEFIWNAGGMILAAIWGLCESLIQGFLDALGIHSPGKMATAIKDELTLIPQYIIEAIPAILQAIVDLALKMLETFKEKIQEIPQIIGQIFGEDAGQFAQTLVDLIIPVLQTLVLIFADFKVYLDQVAQAVQLLMQGDYEGFFNLILTAFFNFVSNVGMHLGNLLVYIWNWGSQAVNSMIQTAWNMVTGFIQWISTLPFQLWNWLTQALSNLWNWGSQMKSNIVQAAINMVNGFIDWISTLPGKTWTWLWNVILKVIEWAASLLTNTKDAAKGAVDGFKEKLKLEQIVKEEIEHIANALRNAIGYLADKARELARNIWNAFKNETDQHSPGRIARVIIGEIGFIDDALTNNNESLANKASLTAQSIIEGFQSNDFSQMTADITPQVNTQVQTNAPTPTVDTQGVGQIPPMIDPNQNGEATALAMEQNSALTNSIISNSQMINNSLNSTQTTLNNLSLTATQVSNMVEQNNNKIKQSYSQMVTYVNNLITTLINKNLSGWNNIRTTTESHLNSILNSTKNVTQQMIQAWDTMKNSIVRAAENIRSESTSRFDRLWSTIKTFYHNIQHPGGAGSPGVSGSRHTGVRSGFSSLGSALKTGLSSVVKPTKKRLTQLDLSSIGLNQHEVEYALPNGRKTIATSDILRYLDGYGAGWESTVKPNNEYIRNESNKWKMKGPVILGKYDTGLDIFKVKDFEHGTPTISYDTFRRMAEAVFSQCHYDFYWDSEKYGSWQRAAYAGYMNCSDSTDFLIAMAHACGLSASKVHGHWNQYGHYWADVAGHKMDTTGWMQHRNWTPAQSHAGPSPEPKDKDIEFKTQVIQLLSEIIKLLVPSETEPLRVVHEGNIQYDFNHDIQGELPDGISKEDVEAIMNAHAEDSNFLKRIANNREFQERFERMQYKLLRERERFS